MASLDDKHTTITLGDLESIVIDSDSIVVDSDSILGDQCLTIDNGNYVYTEGSNPWDLTGATITHESEIREMKKFKDFLIMKGVISEAEFERYKEDLQKIEDID